MAIQTVPVKVLAGGSIVVSLSYDDVSLTCSSVSATNDNAESLFVQVTHDATGQSRSRSVPAGGGSINTPAWPVTKVLNVLQGLTWYVRWSP